CRAFGAQPFDVRYRDRHAHPGRYAPPVWRFRRRCRLLFGPGCHRAREPLLLGVRGGSDVDRDRSVSRRRPVGSRAGWSPSVRPVARTSGFYMSAEPALSVRGLCKNFGALVVAQQIDVDLLAGARVGLIGPNGAGKTTFVNLLTGFLQPDAGTIALG